MGHSGGKNPLRGTGLETGENQNRQQRPNLLFSFFFFFFFFEKMGIFFCEMNLSLSVLSHLTREQLQVLSK